MLFHRVDIGFRLQSYDKKKHRPNFRGGQIRPKSGQMTLRGKKEKTGNFPMKWAFFEKMLMKACFLYLLHDFVKRPRVVLSQGHDMSQSLLPFYDGRWLKNKYICHLAVRKTQLLEHAQTYIIFAQGRVGGTKPRNKVFRIFIKGQLQTVPLPVCQASKLTC